AASDGFLRCRGGYHRRCDAAKACLRRRWSGGCRSLANWCESCFTFSEARFVMPYRQTDNVVRKLAARHDAILAAARAAAAEGGMAARAPPDRKSTRLNSSH